MDVRVYKRGDELVFDEYFRYLEEHRKMIPDSFAEFVCDPERYLPGENSLNGAELVDLRHQPQIETLTLKFKSMNGRTFNFRFERVIVLKVTYPSETLRCRKLYRHQLYIHRKGLYRYEFLSVTHDRIVVDFMNLKITVK